MCVSLTNDRKKVLKFQQFLRLVISDVKYFIFSCSLRKSSQEGEGQDNRGHGVFEAEEHGEQSDGRDGGRRQDHRDRRQGPLRHLRLHGRQD